MSSQAPTRKLRLAVVGATYAFVETRKKIQALAEHFDVVCITAASYTCYGLENRVADQPPPEGYELVALPAVGDPVTTTRYLLKGLAGAIRQHPVDIILVESEPWAWLRWQTWFARMLWQRGALFGEFSWENVRRRGWKGTVLSAFYRAAVATADFVITGNRDAGNIFLDHGLTSERLLVAPQLGLDETLYRPPTAPERARQRAAMECGDGDFLVGFCGRMEEEKGVLDLFEAVRRVRVSGGTEIRLALLGPDGSLSPRLEALRAENPWLRLYPARPHAGIVDFMHALDLFVLPSRSRTGADEEAWKEQFGHVLIEAMGCAVPVLASDCGAIPEVLGEPEQIFAEGDVEELTRRIAAWRGDPAHRAVVIARQRARLASQFTHTVIAAHWAEFIAARHETQAVVRRLETDPEPDPAMSPRACVLTDWRILHTDNRPRRFLDHFQAEADGEFTVCRAINARDDEDLQRKLAFLKTPRARALFSYALAPWQTLNSYATLRRAEFIFCEGPHYFWLLVILNRFGLFSVRGKRGICCMFFPHSRFVKKLGLLNASPPVFRPFFITGEQIRLLEAKGAAPGRVRLIEWKIDARWFHPAAAPTRDYILCPGNIHRDEKLIIALAGTLGLPLVRAGRMSVLRETYAPLTGRTDFRIEVNLDHHAYRQLVQNAALVLLPIEPCDEPAGLTAALEALACRTPVLANPSLGVGPLLEKVFGPGGVLPDLTPETWRAAIARQLARPELDVVASLDAGQRAVRERHAIESEKQDWHDFVAQASL